METQTIRKILTRDFMLCFFAHFGFSFVLHSLMPTLPIYLSRLRSNEVDIGILMGSFAVSALFLRPFVGRALVRIPEKNFMIAGAFLYVLTSAAYLFAPPFWPFLIVRVFQGIGFAFFHTASFTLIANITSEANRGQSLSYFTLASTVSSALGPPLGIFLINHFGFTLLFPACVGVSACSLLITSKLGARPVVSLRNPAAGDTFFSRQALPPAFIGFYCLFTWGTTATFFPLYALAHGMSNPGLFFTTVAIMLILCRILAGKVLDRYGRERILPPSLTVCIISMVALAFSKTIPMFVLVAVIWGIGYAFLMPLLLAYTVDRAGSSLGPAMGTFTAVSDLGLSLGPPIMGTIIYYTSYSIMFLCLALMGFLSLNYFLFFVKKKGWTPNRLS